MPPSSTPPRAAGGSARGVIALAAVGAATVLAFVPFLPLALFKLAAPGDALKRRLTPGLVAVARTWARIVSALFHLISGVSIECRGQVPHDTRGRYLLIANHRAWADIPVLLHCLDGRLPFPRFFIKYELLRLPIVGFACWAMDFPFMHRYRKRDLARRPDLKGRDLETTRKACAKYRHQPVTVVNFAEGTRFTPAKHANTRSPYRYLLRPKAAGSGFMMQELADVLSGVLDVTIVYADCRQPTMWDYACGRVRRVVVRVDPLPLPTELLQARYEDESAVRRGLQRWMNEIWRRKDSAIAALLDDAAADTA